MTALAFTYAGHEVRTAGTPDAPLFVAADVCRVLEIVNAADALTRLDEDEKGIASIYTLGGTQEMATVTESGLYSLILGSRKPEAKAFKRWVTSDVLPAIRKTGRYEVAPTNALPRTFAEALRALADTVEEKERLALAVADMVPKAAFFDAVTDSKTAIEMAAVAKVLNFPGIGRTKLFARLRDKKVLRKDNSPYQEFIDRDYFRVVEQKWNTPDGETRITLKTLVFQKGLDFIRQLLGGDTQPTTPREGASV